jgi:hypothetical protein
MLDISRIVVELLQWARLNAKRMVSSCRASMLGQDTVLMFRTPGSIPRIAFSVKWYCNAPYG